MGGIQGDSLLRKLRDDSEWHLAAALIVSTCSPASHTQSDAYKWGQDKECYDSNGVLCLFLSPIGCEVWGSYGGEGNSHYLPWEGWMTWWGIEHLIVHGFPSISVHSLPCHSTEYRAMSTVWVHGAALAEGTMWNILPLRVNSTKVVLHDNQ